jgi:hypothetical protein
MLDDKEKDGIWQQEQQRFEQQAALEAERLRQQRLREYRQEVIERLRGQYRANVPKSKPWLWAMLGLLLLGGGLTAALWWNNRPQIPEMLETSSDLGPLNVLTNDVLVRNCQDLLQERLDLGVAAEFPSPEVYNRQIFGDDNCKIWNGWVNYQNRRGNFVRRDFSCTYISTENHLKITWQ